MKGFTLLLLLVLSFSVQSCVVQEFGHNPEGTQTGAESELGHVHNELLVMFREGTDESKITAINQSLDVQVVRQMLNGRVNLIKVPKGKSVEEVRRAYLSFAEVESANLNYTVRPMEKAP